VGKIDHKIGGPASPFKEDHESMNVLFFGLMVKFLSPKFTIFQCIMTTPTNHCLQLLHLKDWWDT